MSDKTFKPSLVGIHVKTAFLPAHSNPQYDQYTFAYSITISNGSDLPVQLMSRHWVITDAGGRVQEVKGDGVVPPEISPQDLPTFEVPIPAFSLHTPTALN